MEQPNLDAATYERVLSDPLAHLSADEPAIRRLAVSALARRVDEGAVRDRIRPLVTEDPNSRVRAEAVEVLGAGGAAELGTAIEALDDPDPVVVEAAVTALGEIADSSTTDRIAALAQDHTDRLVREAAVAALGAIGDPAAVPVLLDLVASGPPQVRRRAVVALSVFDGPDVEEALRAAVHDRNPMVREAAEMVVGRPADDGWEPVVLRERRED